MASNRNEPPKSSGDFDFFANFDEYADELEKEFEEEMKTEGELEKNTDLNDKSLKKFNFFNDENEEENIEKVGKNDVDKPEENNKEDALGEDEELVREREYDYSQYANGTNPASSEELDSPEEEIDEKTGSAADVDEEVAAIDEKWLEDQKKAKQMAKDEADKRIREIYERAHRHTQHAAQSQNATGTPSGVEVANQESSALEIKTAADDIIDRQSLPKSENTDDTEVKHALNEEGNSNTFEMERERVPDYSQWRTTPREHKPVEETTSHSVTDAAGISQRTEEKSLNSAAANLLKKQGVPGASNVEGTAGAIQQADAAKNAAKSVTSGASSIGSGIASSTARNSDNVDEERNKQAKSIQSAAKSSIGALGYLNSKNNVMPTKERGSSPSGSVTGASGISEAPKEDSAAGGWQHPGLGNGKSSVKPVEQVNGKEKRDVEYVRSLEKGSYGQSAQNGHNAMTPSGRGVGMSSGGSITGAPGIQDAPKAAPDAAKTAKKTTDVLQKGAKINAFTGAVGVAGATSEAAAALLHKKDGMRPKFSSPEDGGFADVTGTSKKAGIAHIDISQKTEKTDPLVRHLNQDEVGLSGKRKLGGSQTIKVNGKKVSATEDIEAKGFTKGKVSSKDSSFSYDEKTGKVKLGGLKAKDTSVDKHMRGRSETRIIDSDEALKKSHAVNGKGIVGRYCYQERR